MCTCCNRHNIHTNTQTRVLAIQMRNSWICIYFNCAIRWNDADHLAVYLAVFHSISLGAHFSIKRNVTFWVVNVDMANDCARRAYSILYNVYSYDWFDYDCHQSLICNDTTYSYGEMWINNDLCKLQTICFAKHFFCARWAHCAHWNFLSCRLFGHLTPHAEQSQQFHFAICRAKRCARSAVCMCGCMRSTLCKDIASCLAMVWP